MKEVSVEKAFAAVLLVVVAALLLGNILGHPVFLGFVESDSMSPSLETGDGFITVPTFLTGEPDVGDVIVFEGEEVQGGGLVTHRVVGETEDGYVTKGDANPFTDQDGGEPYVTEDQIVAETLQVGGVIVAIPDFGVGVEKTRGAVEGGLRAVGIGTSGTSIGGPVLLVAGLLLILISVLDERHGASRSRRRSTRSRTDTRIALLVILALVLIPANISMVGPVQVHEVGGSVSADEGESLNAEVTARNDGLVTMLVVIEPVDGDARLSSSAVELPSGESETVTVTPETGSEAPYRLSEHRYFLLLPSSVLLGLHSASPFFALIAVNLLLGVGIIGLVVGLVGTGKSRSRDSGGDVPLTTRLRRKIR